MSAQVAKIEPQDMADARPSALTPLEMVSRAVENGSEIAIIEKLMDLHGRWEAGQGRKAFDAAIADAKGKIPVVIKKRRVHYKSKDQNKPDTDYKHEDLAGIAEVVDPILAEHGLSYRFRTNQIDGGMIAVTCVLSHRDGYSEETTLSSSRDEGAGKNNLQAMGSAITYLQRYTLKAALGIAAGHDDDGEKSDGGPVVITDDQVSELAGLLSDSETDQQKFMGFFKIERLMDLPQDQFGRAQTILKRKIAEATNAQGGDA